VIGYPLAHSISPAFQQPAFDHLQLDVRYRAYETPPAALAAFFAGLRAGDWLGCNVTIPHKRAVLDLVDGVAEEARLIGAVNTVVKGPDGRLVGHNTDAGGFLRALVEDAAFDPRGKGAVLLGAGGAALAVAVALVRAGADRLWLANRTPGRAEALADSLAHGFPGAPVEVVPLEQAALRRPLAEAALLVNGTSVGMAHGPAPEATPLPVALLGPHLVVYDLVYNPPETPLLRAAARAGARTQEGLPMLIYQGALAFERWTGRAAPVALMLAQGRRALGAPGAPPRSSAAPPGPTAQPPGEDDRG
jgi:shikimate dehydrogenase